jgi:hypothetical protein
MPLLWKIKSKTSTLSHARKANSKKWQSEIRPFLPVRGGAGPVRVAHHDVSW